MKKVAFKALGCRLNQYEVESLATEFAEAGYQIVPFEEEADAYILNTCTVTNQSDHKSRKMIGKILKGRHKDSISVVTGCFATHNLAALEEAYDITYLVDNDHKASTFDLVDAHFRGEMMRVEDLEKDLFRYKPSRQIFRTRSLIKIQDGCDNFCSFCVIPFVRGRAASRPPADILQNVHKALEAGYKEIVLTGVNIGRYEHDAMNFSQLVESVLTIDQQFRLRISSLEPEPLDDRFIDLLTHPKFCPHLHICLQSGSEQVLLRMRRAYSYAQFENLVQRIRTTRPDCNLTTDIMVGFPGESDEEFEQSLKAVSEIAFPHVHIFRYSMRNSTKAARMEDQVPDSLKVERSSRLQELVAQNKEKYFQSFIGKQQRVLVEHCEPEKTTGHGEHYVPIMVETADKAVQISRNDFLDVRISGLASHQDEPILRGSII